MNVATTLAGTSYGCASTADLSGEPRSCQASSDNDLTLHRISYYTTNTASPGLLSHLSEVPSLTSIPLMGSFNARERGDFLETSVGLHRARRFD